MCSWNAGRACVSLGKIISMLLGDIGGCIQAYCELTELVGDGE